MYCEMCKREGGVCVDCHTVDGVPDLYERKEYITRDSAIEATLSCTDLLEPSIVDTTVNNVAYKLRGIPAEDVQPVKHGRWINTMPNVEYKSFCQVKCSICESIEAYGNFCRNCGADMRGE